MGKSATTTVASLAALCLLALLMAQSATAGSEPRLTDPQTTFHRLHVTGPGDTDAQEAAFIDDSLEIQEDLETPENQAGNSSSRSLTKPTKQQLRNTLNALKLIAEPGDEVTLFFGGHGGNDVVDLNGDESDANDEFIWLNDPNGDRSAELDEVLTDDELAEMLSGFRFSVTLVVVLSACAAGGFTDGTSDVQETDHVALIGATAVCPIDPPGALGALIETLGEAVADAAGERKADANGDGTVTAEEVKARLKSEGWRLGPPPPGEHLDLFKAGDSACAPGRCLPPPPALASDRNGGPPGALVNLTGRYFSSNSSLALDLVKPDLTTVALANTTTNEGGAFSATISVPDGPPGTYLMRAVDSQSWEDWILFTISPSAACRVAFDPTWQIEHRSDMSLARIRLSAVDHLTGELLANVNLRLSAFKPDGTSQTSFRTPTGRQAEGTLTTTRPGELRVEVEVLEGCQPVQPRFEQSYLIGPCPGGAMSCEGPPPRVPGVQRRLWAPGVVRQGTVP